MDRQPVTGGLLLPPNLGVSPAEERKITLKWNTLEGVVETLNRWGFSEAASPITPIPTITAEMLLTPDIQQYTILYASQLHWYNYSNILRARVTAELLQIENEMDDIGAHIRKGLRDINKTLGKKDTLGRDGIEDEVTTDASYRSLRVRAQELRQYKMELEARVEELESGMKVISRQVEIRKEEAKGGTNAQNMPSRSDPRRFSDR